MEKIKKIGYFFIVFAYVVGVIGGIGYLAYLEQWVIMIALIIVAFLAAPSVIDVFKKLEQ